MTDHTPEITNPQDELEPQVEPELSLEDKLKLLLDEIQEVDPGLMEAQQVIDDDGTPKFIHQPQKNPTPPVQAKPVPTTQSAPTPTPTPTPDPVSAPSQPPEPTPPPTEILDEDELANLINQAIDQASQSGDDTDVATDAPSIAPTSEEDLAKVVDRDIDQAVAQATQTPAKAAPKKPAAHPKVKTFNPADNFIPIEPEELADAIDEAFETPKPVAQPVAPTPVAPPQPVVQEAPAIEPTANNIADMADDARLNNDDLDALFDAPAAPVQASDPLAGKADDAILDSDDLDALFADSAGDAPALAQTLDAISEDDLALALDNVLGQAKQKMADLADEKLARQSQLQAQHIQKLKEQAQPGTVDANIDQLLEGQPHSVFDDQAFAQQWDQVLDQAREQLTTQIQQGNDANGTQSPHEADLEQALDSVLGDTVTKLNELTNEKLKQSAQEEDQKIESLGQGLSLDNSAVDSAQATPTSANDLSDTQLDEADFAESWDLVLSEAKEELNKIAHAKKSSPLQQRLAEKKQASEPQQTSPAPEEDIDLASELDALFASADAPTQQADTPEPQAASESTQLTNDELTQQLDGLLSSVSEDSPAPSPASAPEVTADQLHELVDSDSQALEAQEIVEEAVELPDTATDQPQDPAAMITHIDSLLAEHADDAVSGVFETPGQIANGDSISEADPEAAFESPEDLLQKTPVEKPQPTAKAPTAKAPPAKAAPVQTPITEQVPPTTAQKADPDDLEGYFESPDAVHATSPVEPAKPAESQTQTTQPPVSEAATTDGVAIDDDMLMGDFVAPEESIEEALAEDAYETPQEVLPAEQAVPVAQSPATEALDDDANALATQAPSKGTGLLARIKSALNIAKKTTVTIAGHIQKQLVHLSPAINKACALINKPLQRFDSPTRNLIGYVGLVNMFIGVILFCLMLRNMLFGS
ncbi:MAG: hypothetical protein JKX85_09745 [Phycisphaeraceae bacterium]|nr:hypothetical protein [Phycisphaeraceae bacterium]